MFPIIGEYYAISSLQNINLNCTLVSINDGKYWLNSVIIDECYFFPRSVYSFPDSWIGIMSNSTTDEFKTTVKNGGVYAEFYLLAPIPLPTTTTVLFYNNLQLVNFVAKNQMLRPQG